MANRNSDDASAARRNGDFGADRPHRPWLSENRGVLIKLLDCAHRFGVTLVRSDRAAFGSSGQRTASDAAAQKLLDLHFRRCRDERRRTRGVASAGSGQGLAESAAAGTRSVLVCAGTAAIGSSPMPPSKRGATTPKITVLGRPERLVCSKCGRLGMDMMVSDTKTARLPQDPI